LKDLDDMARYRLNVNGHDHDVVADPDTPLLYVLRDELHLKGPKFGCGLAQCGACTAMIGGNATRSCVYPIAAVGSQPVVTVEGLPKKIHDAFVAEQAAQCGYCIPGMMVEAAGLLRQNAHPTDSQIRDTLNGNLCRCGTHLRILRAVKRAAGENI
jgi:nicotinate dehydrogenase subunit A